MPVRRLKSTGEYRGKQTKTGNSLGFRFDGALFKSHPEFSGEVTAHVIAPGRMLVTVAEPLPAKRDAVMESFLAFLASDIANDPGAVKPLDAALMERIDGLVAGVRVAGDESLGDNSLL